MSSGQKTIIYGIGCIACAYMHSFPHPVRRLELLRTWVSIVGNKLKEIHPMKIYKNKKICEPSFHIRSKGSNSSANDLCCIINQFNWGVLSPSIVVLLERNYCFPRLNESPGDPNFAIQHEQYNTEDK